VQVAERPLVGPLARAVERRRWGLLPALHLPGWAGTAASMLLLDYTLYLWHAMSHRVPFLWRFHRVHHAGLDMDASTAIRFHFGESVLGVPYRALQVALIGVSPRALALWQRLTLAEILLHGTLKLNVPQVEVRIGVPEHRRPEDVTLPRLVAMPFERQRREHEPPVRRPLPGPPGRLVP